jgi:hypothetical protein
MVTILKKKDADLSALKKQLELYEKEHPGAQIELYRQNPGSIRVRVIDDSFSRVPRMERHDQLWKYLEPLKDDIQQQISVLLLLAKKEMKESLMSLEFDDPISSRM